MSGAGAQVRLGACKAARSAPQTRWSAAQVGEEDNVVSVDGVVDCQVRRSVEGPCQWCSRLCASGCIHNSTERSTYMLVYKAQHCINQAHQKVSRGVMRVASQ